MAPVSRLSLLIAALPILAVPLPVPLQNYAVRAPNGLAEAMGARGMRAALGRAPLVGCLSAISVHPYLFMGAIDDAPRWWQQFRTTLGPAARKPLVASEWGLSTDARRQPPFYVDYIAGAAEDCTRSWPDA